MSIKKVTKGKNSWKVELTDERLDDLVFDFTFLPSKWFVDAHKSYLEIEFSLESVSVETINRYHYSMNHFYTFLKENGYNLAEFSELTNRHIRLFLYYLKQSTLSSPTQSLVIAGLKRLISVGRSLDEPGYPVIEIFDGRERRALKPQEAYTTEIIPDSVMVDIEEALKQEKDIMFRSLLEIIIDTGLRCGDALGLKVGCITLDFKDKPVLEFYSKKTKTEKYIPVSNRVKKAVEKVTNSYQKVRHQLETDYLFVYYSKQSNKNMFINNHNARYYLKKFIKKNNFKDENGERFHFTYHYFRHKLGTDMSNNNMNYNEIMQYLGHSSTRSTEHYVKTDPEKVFKEYNSLGFIGLTKDKEDSLKENVNKIDERELIDNKEMATNAALPDGICSKPFNNEGNQCTKFNMCVLCPKFITTPDFLSIHKNHLRRLQDDRLTYMSDEFIGTEHHLDLIEESLTTIIKKLEMISDE